MCIGIYYTHANTHTRENTDSIQRFIHLHIWGVNTLNWPVISQKTLIHKISASLIDSLQKSVCSYRSVLRCDAIYVVQYEGGKALSLAFISSLRNPRLIHRRYYVTCESSLEGFGHLVHAHLYIVYNQMCRRNSFDRHFSDVHRTIMAFSLH